MADPTLAAAEEFRAAPGAEFVGFLLAVLWGCAAALVLADRFLADQWLQAWVCALGFAVLGAAIGEILHKSLSSLRLSSDGMELLSWRGKHAVRWGEVAALLRRERLAVGMYGIPVEETEIILGGTKGSRLLVIPGSLGTLAAARLEEVLLSRGFTKTESEGSAASWLLLAPDAPREARSLSAPDGPYRVKNFASRSLSNMIMATIPFGALTGWNSGFDWPGAFSSWLSFGCGGTAFLMITLALAGSLHRDLRPEGRLRTQFVLCLVAVLATLGGYLAGSHQWHAQTALAQTKADAIVAAVVSYHQRTGQYPPDLDFLPLRAVYYDLGNHTYQIVYERRGDGFEVYYTMDTWMDRVYDSQQGRWHARGRD